jgi:hypothetical protein
VTRACGWLALAAVALVACVGPGASKPHATQPSPAACHVRGTAPRLLPDPTCTPGATNPAVTQATIRVTICVRGWATRQRPPDSWTAPRKVKALRAYGYYSGTELGGYEYDHLVPLSLGGAPRDERNLWPEAGASPNAKDRVEAKVRAAVCGGRMALAAAQAGFMADWTQLG